MRRLLALPNLIFLSLILGALAGWLIGKSSPLLSTSLLDRWDWLHEALRLGGDIFKSLILMVVMPLVVFSLIGGMMSLGDVRKLGRVAVKTLLLYAATATLACASAVILANALKPGRALPEERRDELARQYQEDQRRLVEPLAGPAREDVKPSLWNFARSLVPTNIVNALSDNRRMLPVIFFALFFGLVAATLEAARRDRLADLVGVLTEVMVRMVRAVMWTAPVGVFCLIAAAAAGLGLDLFRAMAAYCLVIILGLLVQFFVIYGGVIKLLTRLRFADFLRASRPALVTAFSTSSSAAALPVNMEVVARRLNVSPGVTSFVLPIGTTVNMDGTAIMQSVAAIFLAQLYSVDIGLTGQLLIITTAMFAAIGTAPIPSAGIAMLVLILEPLRIPLDGIALIWAVDRPLDMLRTVVNVMGDGVAAAAIASTEGEDVRFIPGESPLPVSVATPSQGPTS